MQVLEVTDVGGNLVWINCSAISYMAKAKNAERPNEPRVNIHLGSEKKISVKGKLEDLHKNFHANL